MKKPKQIIAGIDPVRAKKLKVRLVREGCSYRQWLEDRIDEYLQDVNKTNRAQTRSKENVEKAQEERKDDEHDR